MVFKLRARRFVIPILSAALLTISIDAWPASAITLADVQQRIQTFEQRAKERAEAANTRDAQKIATADRAGRLALHDVREAFRALDADKTDDIDVLRVYVDFLIKVGDFDLAAKSLNRAILISPNDLALSLRLARAYYYWGEEHDADAQRVITGALRNAQGGPEAAELNALLGRVYMRMGLFDFARESFEKAVAADPKFPVGQIGLATLQIRDAKMKEGSDLLDTLQELPPQFEVVLEEMLQQCIHDFISSGKWFPDDAAQHLAYGKILFRANRIASCPGPIERAIKLDPQNFIAYNLLGNAYRSLEKPDQAIAAFRQSLALNPDQPRTQDALQQVLQSKAAQPTAPAPESALPVPAPPVSQSDSPQPPQAPVAAESPDAAATEQTPTP
jgi:Flp pilus assembly protein TadD